VFFGLFVHHISGFTLSIEMRELLQWCQHAHICVEDFWGRMHNTVVTATSKLK